MVSTASLIVILFVVPFIMIVAPTYLIFTRQRGQKKHPYSFGFIISLGVTVLLIPHTFGNTSPVWSFGLVIMYVAFTISAAVMVTFAYVLVMNFWRQYIAPVVVKTPGPLRNRHLSSK